MGVPPEGKPTPPNTGAAPRPRATGTEPLIGVVGRAIDASEVVDAVTGHDAGAIAVFLGTVRETAQGRRVLFLEYEAYAPMAEAQMRAIALALVRDIGPCRVAMLHRVGRLELGETSVAIAIASAHRRIALEACAEAIERVKKTVPIWKKEHFEGGAVWIEGDPSAPEGRFETPR